MKRGAPELDYAAVSAVVSARLGLHFPPERWPDLARGLEMLAREMGLQGASAAAAWLLATPLTPSRAATLACHLTVGETYFLREKPAMEALERQVLPGLWADRLARREPLRAWSAGCCTGEEPYTLAILLERLCGNSGRNLWEILGTDVNPHFLAAAERGVYGNWSFRDTPPGFRENGFEPTAGGQFAVLPRFRAQVTFGHLNLAEDAYPSARTGTEQLDLILCRNVLMYFADDQRRRVLARLTRCLRDGGWLVVGIAETALVQEPELVPVAMDGCLFFRRPAGRPAAAAAVETAAPALLPRLRPAPRRAPVSRSLRHAETGSVPAEIRSLQAAGHYEDAACRLDAFLQQHPHHAEAQELMARVCADAGRLEEAADWCRQALRQRRLAPELHCLMAVILQDQGRFGDAAEALRRAVYLEPGFVLAHYLLGSLSLQHGRRSGAVRHFTHALRLLESLPPDEAVPESGGLTAGRLREIIDGLMKTRTEGSATP